MMQFTRKDHIQWSKDRALAILESETIEAALNSMIQDLQLHKETENHMGIICGTNMVTAGFITTKEGMQKLINAF